MGKKKNKFKIIISITLIFIFVIVAFNNIIKWNKNSIKTSTAFGGKNLNASLQINDPSTEYQKLKVLIIEINPILNSITNTELYSSNDGHPKVSDLFNVSTQKAVDELISDFEDTSHGYIDVEIANWEFLNEFPTYTKPVELENGDILTQEIIEEDGTKRYRITEDKYLQYAHDEEKDEYSWWALYNNEVFGGNAAIDKSQFSFDYDYIVEKMDLINRRNNHEFDQVWLTSIDPSFSYETMMIGNAPFYINGACYVADCPNFIVGGASMNRRDGQFHAFGHGAEGVLTSAFSRWYTEGTDYTGKGRYRRYKIGYDHYKKDAINISDMETYNSLNWWEKFVLNDYTNSGTLNSVGNVHMPYNASKDYDYINYNMSNTNWREWLNFPNIEGVFENDNRVGWYTHEVNQPVLIDPNSDFASKDPDRIYMRFWFYLMPHYTGYTADGYLQNWWKYIYSLDFVEKITINDQEEKQFEVGDKIEIDYSLLYHSGNVNNSHEILEGNNIQVGNRDVLDFINGKLYAVGEGYSTIKINYDGKSIEYVVEVGENVGDIGIRVKLNKTNLELTEFQTEKLIATVIGDPNIEIKWRSEDTNVATVDNDGNVTAVGAGQTKIKVETVDGIELARCKVKVKEIEPFVPPPIEPPIEIGLNVEFINYSVNETNDEIVYLENIKLNEKISDLKNNTKTNGEIEILNEEGNQITDENEILKTGTKLKITWYGEQKEYILVVTGDITGDGKGDARDLLKLARYLSKLENISGSYYLAANIYKDTEDVNNADLLKFARILAQLDTFD